MHLQKILLRGSLFASSLTGSCHCLNAQMITGVWQGKMDRRKVEVKIVQKGDSLTGTSYYYESPSNYRRYTIKGYFDANDNSVVWWDDQLIEDKTRGLNVLSSNKPGQARADFNCPGGGVMKLDGKTYHVGNQQPTGDVHLDKVVTPSFYDEWDYVIENYTLGANDPDIIDSVALLAKNATPTEKLEEKHETIVTSPEKEEEPVKKDMVTIPVPKQLPTATQANPYQESKINPPTIEQKFTTRDKVFTKEIPVTGDSIELRFYDNAEVDGDSISLFLNDKLIFEHIRLTEKAYVVKLAVSELNQSNELTMVAENLGAIPPNTSYMVALVGNKRYDAQLASTENASAMIRLEKAAGGEQ